MRRRVSTLYAALIAVNLGAWGWALAAFHDRPAVLGMALIAYGFGLRHAVDADHIAAIDNVTCKLMQDGKRPVAVGLFFALGHSTIVVAAAAVLAASATTLRQRYPGFVETGGAIGTTLSAAFLFAIAAANTTVLVGLHRALGSARRGGGVAGDVRVLLARRGLLAWALRRLFGLISRSWHMYPLGALFALGFDTASEIGLLGITAGETENGLSMTSILAFPALFAAGMALIDTSDGVLMVGAYGWAAANPPRKLYYNLAITALSVVVAVLVGSVEVLGLIADRLGLAGGAWDIVAAANGCLGTLGCVVILVFAVGWGLLLLVYRLLGWDKIGSV